MQDTRSEVSFRFLDWDSDFFGKRIGRVLPKRISAPLVAEAERWSQVNRIDCLYFLADSADTRTVEVAEQAAFHLVDIRMTFQCDVPPMPPGRGDDGLRVATLADLDDLRAVAKDSHHDSRFYADRHFERARADALYERWIENELRDRSGVVFVPDVGGRAAGYITCRVIERNVGEIGLLAVAEGARNSGAGAALVRAALRWFAEREVGRATVVTQGRNAGAQRVYQRAGFLTRSVELWYHRWF